MKIEKVDESDYKTIITLRNSKKITQKDLAKKLNLQHSVIVSLERGELPKDKNFTNRIKNFLQESKTLGYALSVTESLQKYTVDDTS